MQRNYRLRTTATKACAYTVHALLGLDLADDDLATLDDALSDIRRAVERDGCSETSSCSNSGDGQGVPVNYDRVASPGVFGERAFWGVMVRNAAHL